MSVLRTMLKLFLDTCASLIDGKEAGKDTTWILHLMLVKCYQRMKFGRGTYTNTCYMIGLTCYLVTSKG